MQSQWRLRLTLVPLLLALNLDGEVLALLPVNLVTLGVVVDEVATVAVLLLVVVGFADGFVGEEGVLGKLENEAEAGAVKVLHANVGQVLERLLVTVGDGLGKGRVLHGAEPELGDTLQVSGGSLLLGGRLLGLLVVLVILALSLASLDLLLGGLSLAVDNLGALLVQRGELGEELLLELEDLLLELGLELGVLLLDTLEAVDTSPHGRGERLDVARGAADEAGELVLHHGDKARVLGEERGGGSAVEVLCAAEVVSMCLRVQATDAMAARGHSPSLMSATVGAWARLEMGAFWAGVFWGVLVSMVLVGGGTGRVTMVCVGERSRRWRQAGRGKFPDGPGVDAEAVVDC